QWIYDAQTGPTKFKLSYKDDFRNLWNTLDGKMKQLKRNRIIPQHHDPLTEEETSLIFNDPNGGEHGQMKISQFKFLPDSGIIFTKWSQKNDQGGLDDNGNATSIPIPPDPLEKPGPVHDIQLYFSK
ncbi:3660_t:CDS:2, partial [Cetraspora pellucida]